MPVVLVFDVAGATPAQYDRTNEILGIRGDADAPDGLISHVCGASDDGLLIVDVWESEEVLRPFVERVAPAAAEAGMSDVRPRILPMHNLIARGKGTDANVLLFIEPEGFGPEMYDRVIAHMDAHQQGGENHPAVSHVAAVAEDGGLVIADVWSSPEAFYAFAQEQLAEFAAELGELHPRFVPVYNRLRGKAPAAA
jgi:hypothetical protein